MFQLLETVFICTIFNEIPLQKSLDQGKRILFSKHLLDMVSCIVEFCKKKAKAWLGKASRI